MANRPPPPSSVVYLVEHGPVRLHGTVRADAEERDRSMRFVVNAHTVEQGGVQRPASGGVLVRVAVGRTLRAGDMVTLEGHLALPPELPHFAYPAYLARQGILAQMDYPRVIVTGHKPPGRLLRPAWLLDARRTARNALERALPYPESALAHGIITGERAALPRDLTDAFDRSGTSHLIAISGYNITLVSGLVFSVLAGVTGRRRAALLALVVIVLYALFVGLTPSVTRALVMGMLVIGAGVLGRPGAPIVSLAIAAAVMTAHDPRIINDLAFQLSFTATAGIMLLVPAFQQAGRALALWGRVPGSATTVLLAVWDTLAVTMAATLATLPVMLHAFGRVSLVAPLANVVLAPVFPLALLASAGVAVIGATVPAVVPVVAALAELPLALTIATARTAAALPAATLDLGYLNGRGVLALYAAGIIVFVLLRRAPSSHPGAAERLLPVRLPGHVLLAVTPGGLVLALALRTALAGSVTEGRLTVHYALAGGVPVALVTGPGGERVLVDAGPSGAALTRTLDPLLPRHDRRIHLLLLTRHTPSATGGLEDAIARYAIRAVAAPAGDATSALPVGGAAFHAIEPGSVIALSRDARLVIETYPGEGGRLAVLAAFGRGRFALTPGVEASVRLQRGASARPDDLLIVPASFGGRGYGLRAAGSVRIATDGVSLWLRPERGPLLPPDTARSHAPTRPTLPLPARMPMPYPLTTHAAMLADVRTQEDASDPRRWTSALPAPARSHHPRSARLRGKFGARRVRAHTRVMRRHRRRQGTALFTWQRARLGDSGVRHASACHADAHPARVRGRAYRRAHA
jgi:competence protein ComEC